MHPDFGRWYGEVSMDGAGRAERWSGIEQIAAKADRAFIEVLVRLAFRTKAPPGGNREALLAERLVDFHAAFRDHDETYDSSAAREAELLAAAALAHLFAVEPLAPLAVTTATAGGARKPDLPMNLAGLAENAIRALGEKRRKRPDLTALKMEPVTFSYAVDAGSLDPQAPATFVAAFDGLCQAVTEALEEITDHLDQSVQTMGHYIQVSDEEQQLLWWLVNGSSLDLGRPFRRVPAAAQPLVFAKELADRTVGLPGPLAIGALLLRAGLKSKGEVGIAAAVGALEDTWITDAIQDIAASPVTSPLHFALEKRAETGAGNAWVAGWAAISDLTADFGSPPVTLGELFYRERLLLKCHS